MINGQYRRITFSRLHDSSKTSLSDVGVVSMGCTDSAAGVNGNRSDVVSCGGVDTFIDSALIRKNENKMCIIKVC